MKYAGVPNFPNTFLSSSDIPFTYMTVSLGTFSFSLFVVICFPWLVLLDLYLLTITNHSFCPVCQSLHHTSLETHTTTPSSVVGSATDEDYSSSQKLVIVRAQFEIIKHVEPCFSRKRQTLVLPYLGYAESKSAVCQKIFSPYMP